MIYEFNKDLYKYLRKRILEINFESFHPKKFFNSLEIPNSIPINDNEAEALINLLQDKNLHFIIQCLKQRKEYQNEYCSEKLQ